ARYNGGGGPDTTFGADANLDLLPDGVVTVPVGGTSAAAYAVALQGNGGIIAAGTTSTTGGGDFVLARVDPNTGLVDTGFGANGVTTTDFGAADAAEAVVIQPDQNILVAGRSGTSVVLARYDPSGQLDASFGSGGKLAVPQLTTSGRSVG